MPHNYVRPKECLSQRFACRLLVTSLVTLGLVLPLASVSASAASTKKASGTVDVLYAGSFLDLMTQKMGPAFHKATGYTVSGFSAGSTALASEIKGGTQVGDVFISASPSVNASLGGASNGHWVSSYREFGYSPLMLGYYANSKFAKDLTTKPWYDVVNRPGFLLGRTDPATDPKGVLAVDALKGAARTHHLPALNALATSSSNIFAETALVGELQAGQLDAGFFYGVEAAAAHIKTVALKGTELSGKYTVAILNKAPHKIAAKAFVKFLLSKAGQAILKKNGVTPIVPARVTKASTTTTTAATTKSS
ncbi:MAG TPA: extracellular solute-binding protein [Acidimicrobiales bacterium]|nr:extracellular solute-binding protein [Acidimicrobiales bacterium]